MGSNPGDQRTGNIFNGAFRSASTQSPRGHYRDNSLGKRYTDFQQYRGYGLFLLKSHSSRDGQNAGGGIGTCAHPD